MYIQACVFSIYYPTVIITKLIAACIRNVILISYRKKHLVDKKNILPLQTSLEKRVFAVSYITLG